MLRFKLALPFLLAICVLPSLTRAQNELHSGPMLGHWGPRTARVWVRTNGPASVRLAYWPTEKSSDTLYSRPVRTKSSEALTAHLLADSLHPGQSYRYRILLDGQSLPGDPSYRFRARSLPEDRGPAPSFSMAFGSCAFFNDPSDLEKEDPYGKDPVIFRHIARKDPDFMLWGGDNVYFRSEDLHSLQGMYHRYARSRQDPHLDTLLRTTHHYAIWDDHDYGPNNSDRSWGFPERSLKAFQRFWMSSVYQNDAFPGVTGSFSYGDVDLFLLDDRWFRTPQDLDTRSRQLLGEKQIDRLIEGLLSSEATFKLIAMGGQVLNPAPVFETYANYPEERKRLLRRIQKESIEGVVFLTGDRHHSELSKLDTGSVTLYDLTVSPFTSSPAYNEDEDNELRVEGSYVSKNAFALLEFQGGSEERVMRIRLADAKGRTIWERSIEAP